MAEQGANVAGWEGHAGTTGGSSGPFLGGGGKFWRRGPNIPPFSCFSADLGHFILKLLNFDIYFFYFMLNF